MRIALISDVHGNSVALDACLRVLDRHGVEERYFLGDVVGYLPAGRECVERLDRVACQLGNHDAMLLGELPLSPARNEVYRLDRARDKADAAMMATLGSWPHRREITFAGRTILLVHGSPSEPLEGYVYPDSDLSGFADLTYDAVFMGHTHRPFLTRVGATLIANVGSVGLPRDVGRLAACAVYDSEEHACTIVRVPFDVDAVIARWENDLHAETIACLRRESSEFVGEVVL
jgi:predicted phosphodiesterase